MKVSLGDGLGLEPRQYEALEADFQEVRAPLDPRGACSATSSGRTPLRPSGRASPGARGAYRRRAAPLRRGARCTRVLHAPAAPHRPRRAPPGAQ